MAANSNQGQMSKKTPPLKWSEKHDICMCREVLLVKPYQFKPGSVQSGQAWTSIAEDLCAVQELTFSVNQKSVRDRYRLLLEKHKKKMRAQESASGASPEFTEVDQILQDILEESREAAKNYEKQTQEKEDKIVKDRKEGEEIRKKALESLGQTTKRLAEEGEASGSRKRPRKSGSETMVYLESKAEKEFELKQQELKLRKDELEKAILSISKYEYNG